VLTNKNYLLIALGAAIALLFLLFPYIDIAFSSLFFDTHTGKFAYKDSDIVRFLYHFVIKVIQLFTIGVIILLVLTLYCKKEFFNISKKKLLYLIVVLIVGPILVVNILFKDNWGRARPSHIVEFNGTQKFTPPFVKTNQCDTNCSFVCGHASAAFYFFALIPLVAPRNRKAVAWFALLFGTLIGLVRIIQGGHFLSDVIFSGFFVYFSYKIVYWVMFERNVQHSKP